MATVSFTENNNGDVAIRYRSEVWKHFTREIESQQDGSFTVFAKCIYCTGGRYCHDSKANRSTGNMRLHLVNKHPDMVKPLTFAKVSNPTVVVTPNIQQTTELSRSDAVNPSLKLVRFLISSDLVFKIVEDKSLKDLLCTLNPVLFHTHLQLTDDTLRNYIMEEYWHESENITRTVKNVHGQMSFALDCWTSANVRPFIAVTCHWLDELWNENNCFLGFMYFDGHHTGITICNKFLTLLRERGITNVLSVTMDNAEINDAFTQELATRSLELGVRFNPDNRIRCFVNVLNYVVQDLLQFLKCNAEHENEYDLRLTNRHEAFESKDISIGVAIAKVRNLVTAIRLSRTKSEMFSELNLVYGLPDDELIIDTKTTWKSTYAMLKKAVTHRASLDSISSTEQDLLNLHLNDEEWSLLDSLINVLRDFDFVTNRMCHSTYPTAAIIMPLFKLLLDNLEKCEGAIKDATVRAFDTMTTHFKHTDTSALWVAMALNPTLKLEWLKERYDANFCKKIKETVVSSYLAHYANEVTHWVDDALSSNNESYDGIDISALYPKRAKRSTKAKAFELILYLKEPVAPPHTNIFQWWKLHEIEYKRVSRMARDYLGIPGSSMASERQSSHGTDLVTPKYSSQNPETIMAILCLKNWWNS